MHAYLPSSGLVLLNVLLGCGGVLLLGFGLQRREPSTWLRLVGWLLVGLGVAAAHFALLDEEAGFRMFALLVLLCYAMKTLVAIESPVTLGFRNWLAYAALWFGMQPKQFVVRRNTPIPGSLALLKRGLLWLVAGSLTFVVARHLYGSGLSLRYAGLLFAGGFIMVLHLGIIPLLAAGFRSLGYNAGPQFHAPWRSVSLQDFWSRRWNVAFSVMTTIVLYRPLVRVVGRNGALFLGFVASGLFHEVACSLPVRAGYGLPTLYFALHGAAVLLERWLHRRGTRLTGAIAILWVYGWVLAPIGLLFHMPFLRGLVLPLL